jgi:hypothetical protein
MSSDSIAFPMLSSAGSHSPTEASGIKQQSKETPPPLDYVTPPLSIVTSKHHSSTTTGSFRLKRHRNNSYDSEVDHPFVRRSSTGRRVLWSNTDSFATGASFPTDLDLSNVPGDDGFFLATPNQVGMKRPAVSMSRHVSSADSLVNSNDEILSESGRHVSLSGMFLPIHKT